MLAPLPGHDRGRKRGGGERGIMPLLLAEGEGFEPPGLFRPSCFQDSRDRPLRHPSADYYTTTLKR